MNEEFKDNTEQEASEISPDAMEDIKEKVIFTDDDRKLQFYEDLRKKVKNVADQKTGKLGRKFGGKLSEYLFLLPDFFVLVSRLAMDSRVPPKKKIFVGAVVAYLIMPLDIIPDFIPVIGHVDDLVLVVLALNQILREVDKQVLLDNWSGDTDLLEMLTKITAAAETFLDKNIWQKINNWLYKRQA